MIFTVIQKSLSKLKKFHQRLSSSLLDGFSQPLAASPSVTSGYAYSAITGHILASLSFESACPSCCSAQDQGHLNELQSHKDIGNEFLTRYRRLQAHPCNDHRGSGLYQDSMMHELYQLIQLTEPNMSRSRLLLQDLDAPEWVFRGLYYPSEVLKDPVLTYRVPTGCLARAPLHQWLDSGRHQPEGSGVHTLMRSFDDNVINKKDVLGRLASHIACHTNWTEVARILLLRVVD
jgi:hypothetical protein